MAVSLKASEKVTHPRVVVLIYQEEENISCQVAEVYQDLVIDWLPGRKSQSGMTPRILVLETT